MCAGRQVSQPEITATWAVPGRVVGANRDPADLFVLHEISAIVDARAPRLFEAAVAARAEPTAGTQPTFFVTLHVVFAMVPVPNSTVSVPKTGVQRSGKADDDGKQGSESEPATHDPLHCE